VRRPLSSEELSLSTASRTGGKGALPEGCAGGGGRGANGYKGRGGAESGTRLPRGAGGRGGIAPAYTNGPLFPVSLYMYILAFFLVKPGSLEYKVHVTDWREDLDHEQLCKNIYYVKNLSD